MIEIIREVVCDRTTFVRDPEKRGDKLCRFLEKKARQGDETMEMRWYVDK